MPLIVLLFIVVRCYLCIVCNSWALQCNFSRELIKFVISYHIPVDDCRVFCYFSFFGCFWAGSWLHNRRNNACLSPGIAAGDVSSQGSATGEGETVISSGHLPSLSKPKGSSWAEKPAALRARRMTSLMLWTCYQTSYHSVYFYFILHFSWYENNLLTNFFSLQCWLSKSFLCQQENVHS